MAISVNWPNLLTPEVLDLFPDGVWNAHAGDLPRYRGNAAPNWAILSGEDAVILTIHRMSAGLDEGPILAQRSFPLDETTYISDVYAFLDEAVPHALDGVGGSLGRLANLPVDRKIYLHVNNTNPMILDDSSERRAVEAAGFEVGRDGREFSL